LTWLRGGALAPLAPPGCALDYPCLVASNKQQINGKKSEKQPENLEMRNS